MGDALFHKPGLIYFWFLNDECRLERVDSFIDSFAAAKVSAVVFHPRPGLLLPYGGEDWFEFIRQAANRCAARGLDVWLYDEDPYPSGSCGGWITIEHPEHQAQYIQNNLADPGLKEGDLFCFPTGKLLWCGAVRESDGRTMDLTARVGVVRRKWTLLEPWDSRYYYPNTPLYSCPRSDAINPEFALRLPKLPEGFSVQAFVTKPCALDSCWNGLADSLNPEVTELFIGSTYERYRQYVGDLFGKSIKAIFTDEPKYFGTYPWTPGIEAAFREKFGYELRESLWRLFSPITDERTALTRLHYRQWCGDRFLSAWLDPVANWCRRNGLALVGHISPEDDPVNQVACVGNLFPCYKRFEMPGIDLIIPAVGDKRHPLLSVGVVSATSVAQQTGRGGVLSESLACSGLEATVEDAAGVLRWQLMMGVTTHVIHGAFNSVEGLRLKDAPPDWGPAGPRWQAMQTLGAELTEIQMIVRDARQVAPVAILWPIRSFTVYSQTDYPECLNNSPMRDELVELLRLCLDCQVGTHFVDEADLWDASIADGRLAVGQARYSHLLVPSCIVVHEKTVDALACADKAGVHVIRTGQGPKWQETLRSLEPATMDFVPVVAPVKAVGSLPRLVEVAPDGTDIRCTGWEKSGRRTLLVMNLATQAVQRLVGGKEIELPPRKICALPS